MKREDRLKIQNKNFQELITIKTKSDELNYRVTKSLYKEYKEEIENRSTFMKIITFIIGDESIGHYLVKEFGKHNLDTLIRE